MINRAMLSLLIITITICSVLFSLCKGSFPLSYSQLLFHPHSPSLTIFLELRLPRTLTAFISGALLALAGSLMQLLLENPLADPYVLGISSGAALITLLMMVLGVNELGLISGAWIGSLMTIFLILSLSKKHRWQTHILLLSGIAIAFGLSACISFILLMTPDENLHSMLFWLAGDLNGANFPWLGLIVLMVGFLSSFLLAPGMNVLSRGEIEAKSLGLATQHYRLAIYLLSSLFTATAVTLAGCIGFVGLITPHLTRLLCGYDQRIVLPFTMLLGGSFLTFADTLARTLFAPEQLPVGIMMALMGVPIFIWLLRHERA